MTSVEKFINSFLNNLYMPNVSGVDELFDVFPLLFKQRKFDVIDTILTTIDLTKLKKSYMYNILFLSQKYMDQVPSYHDFYFKVREEYARRGEPSIRISKLLDRFKEVDPKDKFDPNKPVHWVPYSNYESDLKIDEVIAKAKKIGDDNIVKYLNFYKSSLLDGEEQQHKFRALQKNLGDEELRKRCINALRDMANKLENSGTGWPDIYYCDLPEEPLLEKSFIDGINVIISYPWPG